MGHLTSQVRVATFGGVSAFPVRVAERLGLTSGRGLTLETGTTPDSTSLRDDLLAGRIDIAHAAPDNAVAWADASGPASGPTTVAVWLAGSNGPISLVSRPAGPLASLRGARIGVDAPDSGFAPILVRLLGAAGLGPDDVDLVPLGATRRRYAALADGLVDASMLTLPWSALAVMAGCHRLADHASVAPCLLTSAAIVRRGWLGEHPAVAEGYRAALAGALSWLRDQGSRDAATAWLAEDLGLDEPVAREVLAVMDDPLLGWPAAVDLTRDALDDVIALRASAGRPPARDGASYLAGG
ncbi:MAG: ABC transporter substrate-binding protein [Chloroflexota bacterium]